VKKSCLTWLAAYLLLAAAIGAIVYRRLPLAPAAGGSAVFGGFAAMLGFGYLIGIRRKIAEAMMISRARSGEPPRDGEKVAAIGHISPSGSTLVSPFSKTPCIAYKYEIRSTGENDFAVYKGFGLTPSAIQSAQGTIRLLAYPDLKVPSQFVPPAEALPHAEEYLRTTQFREAKLGNIRDAFKEMLKDYLDDDGSIRTDERSFAADNHALGDCRFIEWLIRPGDPVCAIGLYSAQRGGLIPNPDSPLEQVVISEGPPEGFTGRAVRGAIGYLIGGVIFLGIVTAALTGLYVAIPLDERARMEPAMTPTAQEIRLEQWIEQHLRVPLRAKGILKN
jgi:hypothetical protein